MHVAFKESYAIAQKTPMIVGKTHAEAEAARQVQLDRRLVPAINPARIVVDVAKRHPPVAEKFGVDIARGKRDIAVETELVALLRRETPLPSEISKPPQRRQIAVRKRHSVRRDLAVAATLGNKL